jgi:3',5'-cyclic AMP phosphodiesterase CpdA
MKLIRLLAALSLAPAWAAEAPRFSFAVLTDIQYAAKDSMGARDYRASLEELRAAVEAVNAARPAFVIQLGDLIDGGADNLGRILAVWNTLKAPRYHVLGNHDFALPRAALLPKLGMAQAYYDFSRPGWKLVVLDGMDISVPGREKGTPVHQLAVHTLAALQQNRRPNAKEWNGAISSTQRRWLRGVLEDAAAKKERVIVFCHFPVLAEASTPPHLLWNAGDIVAELDRFPNMAAFMNGHDHRGGYARRGAGIHYVTLPGMVESGARNSWTIVDVYNNRLDLRGVGTAPSRTLAFRR